MATFTSLEAYVKTNKDFNDLSNKACEFDRKTFSSVKEIYETFLTPIDLEKYSEEELCQYLNYVLFTSCASHAFAKKYLGKKVVKKANNKVYELIEISSSTGITNLSFYELDGNNIDTICVDFSPIRHYIYKEFIESSMTDWLDFPITIMSTQYHLTTGWFTLGELTWSKVADFVASF